MIFKLKDDNLKKFASDNFHIPEINSDSSIDDFIEREVSSAANSHIGTFLESCTFELSLDDPLKLSLTDEGEVPCDENTYFDLDIFKALTVNLDENTKILNYDKKSKYNLSSSEYLDLAEHKIKLILSSIQSIRQSI